MREMGVVILHLTIGPLNQIISNSDITNNKNVLSLN